MPEISVEEDIEASPEKLYELVSDVTRMGDWSPETTSCRWLGQATGPVVYGFGFAQVGETPSLLVGAALVLFVGFACAKLLRHRTGMV